MQTRIDVEISSSIGRWLVTGVSELRVGSILKDQAGFFDYLSLKDRTGVLSQNVNNQLQTYATQRHTRAKTLSQIVNVLYRENNLGNRELKLHADKRKAGYVWTDHRNHGHATTLRCTLHTASSRKVV